MASTGPIRHIVEAAGDGARLDHVVAHAAGVSRRQARIWISTGRVRVAGRVARIVSRTLPAGAAVVIDAGEPEVAAAGRAAHPPVPILALDRRFVAVNKPSGLLSEGDPGSPSIETVLPPLLAARREKDTVWLVHRLDAATSGVLLVARTPAAARTLGEAFRRGEVRKDYLALCAGALARAEEVNLPIGHGQGRRWAVVASGKPAATRVTPLATGGGYTLVHAQPRTGRTHQIRVHLSHLGHPLVGDGLYGGPRYTEANPPEAIARTMLHAARLRFAHPETGAPVTVVAPAPPDFVALVEAAGLGEALRAFFATRA